MKMNLLRILKISAWVLMFIMVLHAEQERVGGRRRNRKNRSREKGSKKLNNLQQKRRHHQRRSHPLKEDEEVSRLRMQQQFLQEWQRARSKPVHPPVKRHPQFEVSEWREALISTQSKDQTVLHRSTARLGHHSTAKDVAGKLVLIWDPNMKTHFGCADEIGNKQEIPQDRSWIALVERGSCYFFNKIRLAKLHNASAVIIYNHKDKSEIMNTAGTNVMAMMISSSDGREIVKLVEANDDLEIKISVHKEKRSKPTKVTSTTLASISAVSKSEKINNSTRSKYDKLITVTPISSTSAASSLRTFYLNVLLYFVLSCVLITSCVK